LKPINAGQEEATVEGAAATPAVRWALASLSLSMLLSSLDTSIANVALPTLAKTFDASFQAVQWVVIAYLLAITTMIVASATSNITTAHPEAVASGMRITFAVAAVLIVVALAIAVGSRAFAQRPSHPGDVS